MKLSIIIVNYNVKYFLEQCLYSVQRAIEGIEAEVLVIDNHSTDGSIGYLGPNFPEVRFLIGDTNEGFSRACNKGLALASGDYILFLNPDTLVGEDSFATCLSFFEKQPDCGAVGVRMIDGGGKFLKESKRSFPSPLTSLYKLFGLSAIFPHSKTFARYHLGHLSEKENSEVDVLAGAFMMIKKEVLDKVGGFDERFYMYGEDIDLSYRIQKEGLKNYYVAQTGIIHFKGESTKRGSLNYVKLFYKAMNLFVRKHYGASRAKSFTAAIQAGIWVRALIAVLSKFSTLLFSLFLAVMILISYRYNSTAILVLSALLAIAGMVRWALNKKKDENKTYLVIAGAEKEIDGVKNFLRKHGDAKSIISLVVAKEDEANDIYSETIGKAKKEKAGEIIFCAGSLPYKKIINTLPLLTDWKIRYHHYGSGSIVGSDSSTSGGTVLSGENEFNLVS